MTREQLETHQTLIYFAAVFAAIAFGLLASDSARHLEALVTPAIAVLMYAMFLQIPFLDLRQGLGNRRFIAALLLANFILVPLLVWGITRGWSNTRRCSSAPCWYCSHPASTTWWCSPTSAKATRA